MKRAIPQEPKPESCQLPEWDLLVHSNEHQREGSEGTRRVRNSAAMLGLALSVGASSIFFPRHKDAAAAETPSAIRLASRVPLGMPLANLPSTGLGAGSTTYHTVAPGQTLWQIAQVHGVEIDAIKSANGVTPESTLQPGQVLKIPSRPAPVASPPAPAVSAPALTTASAEAVAVEPQSEAFVESTVLDVDSLRADSLNADSNANDEFSASLSNADLSEKSLLVTEAEGIDQKSLLVTESEDQVPKLSASAEGLDSLEALQAPALVQPSEAVESASGRDRSQISFSIQPRSTAAAPRSVQPQEASVEAEATDSAPVANLNQLETDESAALEASGQLPESLLSESPLEVTPLELPGADSLDLAEGGEELEPFIQVEQSSQRLAALIDQGERPEHADLLTEENAAPTPTPSTQPSRVSAYQIQPGDTLETIARTHGVDRDEIAQVNNLRDPDRIFAGSTLTIPNSNRSAVSPSQPVAVHPSMDSRFRPAEVLPQVVPDQPAAQIQDTQLRIARLQATSLRNNSADIARLRQQLLQSSGIDAGIEVSEDLETIAETAEPTETVSQAPESGTAIAALTPESRAEAAPEFSPEVSLEPDTELLVGQVRSLRQSSGDPAAILARLQQNRQSEVVTLESPVEAEPVAAVETGETSTEAMQVAAINPEFRNRNRPVEVAPVEAAPVPDSVTGDHADLMAAAPLGSDVYAPMNSLPVGQRVSPGMPMLPDASEYLPEAPNRFDGFVWPASGVFTSGYGPRWGRMHRGIDIAGPVGTPIVAAAPGVVVTSGWNSGGYGYMVDIRHPDGSVTRYAHNSRNLVRPGQQVRQGEQIAAMGSTGFSTGPHVHFEIHKPGRGTVNPMAYLPNR